MKIRYLYKLLEIFYSYKTGKIKCDYLPVRVWIEPTSQCNLKCVVCPNKSLPLEQKGFMQMKLFKNIVDQLAGHTYDLNLFHRGESLMHPEFIDMVKYSKSKGIYTRLHTNATFLSEQMSKELIYSGLDFISVSFDGYVKEDYENNRLNSDFEKTREKIIQFLNIKIKANRNNPYTVIQTMEYGDNIGKDLLDSRRKEFLIPFKRLKLDRFIIRKPHNWAGQINGFSNKEEKNLQGKIVCTFPWYAMVILWDGKVTPCPQDFMGKIILGDLNKESLADIWNGSLISSFRKDMAQKKIDQYSTCKTCDRILRSTLLGVPGEYINDFLMDNILGYKRTFWRWN